MAAVLPTRVLGLPQSFLEARQEIQARLYWGPAAVARGGSTNSFPWLLAHCSLLPERVQACSLYGVRVGMCPGVRLEGWLRCFAHLFSGGVCRGHELLLQALQKWQLGFLVSLYLWGPDFAPTEYACHYFLSHSVSLYFVPGVVCLDASIVALLHRFPGPRLSQLQKGHFSERYLNN